MIIKTSFRRLAFSARFCHFLPPFLSGRLANRLYPQQVAQKENAAFICRSSLADIMFSFPRAEYHASRFAICGYWEWKLVVIANTICRCGDTIIDVGSNIGTETLLFAKKVGPEGKVISFEPLAGNFAVLKKQVELNKLDNVVLHQAALSDTAGKLRFVPPQNEWTTGDGRLLVESAEKQDSIEVETLIVDQLLDARRFSKLRLIAMDCEGAELPVLRGSEKTLKEYSPFIILEASPYNLEARGLSCGDLLDFLQARDYSSWEISGKCLRPARRDQSEERNWLSIPKGSSRQALQTAHKTGWLCSSN